MPVPFLGPATSPHEIDAALALFGDRIEAVRYRGLRETCAAAAESIARWAGDRLVPRRNGVRPAALGHRSILADPSHPEMRDRINAMVKMREAFRPFAPAVALEQVHRWFGVPPGTESAVHGRGRRRPGRAPKLAPGRHPRQWLGAGADRLGG